MHKRSIMVKTPEYPAQPPSDPLLKLSIAIERLKNIAAIEPPITPRVLVKHLEDGSLVGKKIGNLWFVLKSSLDKFAKELQEV